MGWHGTGRTDVGKHRAFNQDCYGIADDLHVWVVADGMSTPSGGEVASRIAVKTLIASVRGHGSNGLAGRDVERPDMSTILGRAITSAHEAVRRHTASHPDLAGMGTTVAALHIDPHPPPRATVAHVGDSRVYLMREGRLSLVTRDHSYVETLVQAGRISQSQSLSHPMRHVLTRSIGPQPEVEPDIQTVVLRPDDRFLLCTDGLTKMLDDQRIGEILRGFPHDPEQACQHLVDAANLAGGEDNTTVLVIAAADSL